ncbi:enoyl-CoA hydratase [Rubrobacter xylanophilus]|uniref:Enoyl-CoA hydratase n=1 Tax=Rubrobacter xylanophilus TaxID=49319 RepID=A0A510HH18_9ACTN|nr:enoyl-CoA hydratase/isomerase family protein [Rubrobacter xylanophilus]BBL79282.1 enoyl-CoA hydratase [Rubrobacter xylanophilus]
MADEVILEKDGAIARLILNRPEKHNALSFAGLDELVEALHKAEDDDEIKVIILKGRGPSFCAGHDYDDAVRSYGLAREGSANTAEGESGESEQKPRRPSQRSRLQRDRKLAENYMAFQYSIKPIIAQVHGHCIGAGMYLVELVDLAIAADTAKFSHAEQRLGLAGNTWQLNAQILMYGPKRAREVLLLAEEFNGRRAAELGLVNRSVPENDLESTVESWARKVARHPKDALVMGKAVHQMALDDLGYTQQFWRGYVGHSLSTNIKYEPEDYNFLRERSQRGTRGAFHGREEHFGG